MRCFRPDDRGLGNLEIVRRTGFPKPTVSRLTYTLTRLNYLIYSEQSGLYRLNTAVLSPGSTALAGIDIRERIHHCLMALAREVDGTAALGCRDRLTMIYLECCRGRGPVALDLDVGSCIPIATTAIGRAYIAGMPEAERAGFLAALEREHSGSFKAIARGIEKAIRDIDEQGFCLSLGDWHEGVHAAAVPLTDFNGALFALNCGGPAFRLPPKQPEEQVGPRLVEIVNQLTAGTPATVQEEQPVERPPQT